MSDTEVVIRSYQPSDLEAIQKLHEQSGIDYSLPSMSKLLVNKVLEVNGIPRASLGMLPCAEAYLWLDPSGWTDAAGKWSTIKALDAEATEAAASLGVSSIFCCIPPGYERFGRRIKEIGYNRVRPEWAVYSKSAGEHHE